MQTEKLLSFLFLTFIIYNLTFNIAEGTVRYVSKTGTSTPPYTSWETAADSIQKAINVSVAGDTIYVDNGTYEEYLTVNTPVTMIGMSMDSTIIDGSSAPLYALNFLVDGAMENFTIKGVGEASPSGIRTFLANIFISNCKVDSFKYGIIVSSSSSIIDNCLITNFWETGIDDACFPDTCHSVYRNNIIIPYDWFNSAYVAAFFAAGGSPVFTNNILLAEGNASTGFRVDDGIKRGVIKNNLITGFNREGIFISRVTDTVYIINNSVVYNPLDPSHGYSSITSGTGHRTQIKNNIITNTIKGIEGYSDTVKTDFNLFWEVENKTKGKATLGDSTILADPMFVNDTIPTSEMNYDYHLQKYSPAIDKGDPSVTDVDGTRSDIGMYGGPGGEKYEYLDLAPRTPRNFTHSYDTTYNFLTLNWNMNTEYDFRSYKIFRDTVSGFTPSELNFIAETDTSYYSDNLSNIKSGSVYYRITAVDSQDNESQASNEIAVTLTGVEPGVEIIRDYILYQNYPNPFNPSTIISYEIKERAYVKLMIYDIKGELVSVLVNKEQTAGYYEVEFSTTSHSGLSGISDLASGIYLYRIEVIGEGRIPVYSDMKKMVLIK